MSLILVLAAAAMGKMVGPVPSNDPAQWITLDDYANSGATQNNSPVVAPGSRAEITGIQGAIPYELVIDLNGKIVTCRANSGSDEAASMEAATCQLVNERARFTPALDIEGNPIASIYRSRAMWFASERLRSLAKIPPEKSDVAIPVKALPAGLSNPTTVKVHVLVAVDGKVEACVAAPVDPAAKFSQSEAAQAQLKYQMGAQACPLALPAFKMKAANVKKQAVRSIQTAVIRFDLPPP